MGPLTGIKVVELAGIGPGPMCAMLLADLGATVIRIERREPVDLGIKRPLKFNLVLRNRKAIALDLKQPRHVALALRLVDKADALIEGFRPGVTERMGLGPDVCIARNPRLVYGRMTGWGQDGPLAHAAGHDVNYIALTGALHAIGRAGQPPTIPANIVGDYAGGSLYLAFGILAGIIEARASGKGQVVDAAIVDGTAHLLTSFYGLLAMGAFREERGTNIADSGAYFYEVYECADGKWVSVGPIEGRFHDDLLKQLGIDPAEIGAQMNPDNWPRGKAILAAKFKARTQAQWCELLEGSDACFAPVLAMSEAPRHPHMRARNAYVEVDGVIQPMPAPRFSGTPAATPLPPQAITPENTDAALADWLDQAQIKQLRADGIIV